MRRFSIIGEPHSLRRYVTFGAIGGLVAGTLAAVLGISLPLAALAAGVVAVLAAGSLRALSIVGPK